MKKFVSVLAIFALCFGLFAMTGCSSKASETETEKADPYSQYDLTEYIVLPDYNSYETSAPDVDITDEDVEEEIQALLEAAATTEDVTEGTVDEGDTVVISFEGTLADGTAVDGMSSDSYSLTLGSGSMIDGFEEGLYGATIGEEITLELTFPDPYTNNTDLSGEDAIFVVTVLSKEVEVIPELDEDFIKENSDVETEEEFREYVRAYLEEEEYESQLSSLKDDIWTQLVEETEVLQYPEEELNAEIEDTVAYYEYIAEYYGYDSLADFLSECYSMEEDEFYEDVESYCQSIVKQEMMIYLIAQVEEIEVSDEEYNSYLQELLVAYGFEDEDEFYSYVGVTIQEYAETYELERDMLLTKELDVLYERLLG